jgi:glycosyltransferase involved in cell wall biosynthesis
MGRVIHLVTLLGRKSAGVGAVAASMANEQGRLGAPVSIWSLDTEDSIRTAQADYGLQHVTLRTFRASGPFWLGWSLDMWQALGAEAQEVQLLHQHGIWMAISACSNRFRASTGRPVIITPHGSLEPFALARSRFKKSLAAVTYETKNLHGASCLHALSPAEVESFRRYGLRNPIAMIPNGISDAWLASRGTRDAAIKDLGLPSDRRILLFLSRIHPIKGLPMLLNAMATLRAQLNDWLLVIAGPDPNNYQSEIENIVDQLRLKDRVAFVGPVFGQQKRDLFAASDLFILPSFSEGSPVVVLEALGAGVPVLTTQATPWEDLTKYDCGYWVPIDEDAITNALREAISMSPTRLEEMGCRGRDLVAQEYTWTTVATKMQAVYDWVLKQGDPPAFVVTA